MANLIQAFAYKSGWHNAYRLEKQIKDYVTVGMDLVWQRQITFLAATLLSAFYFDVAVAFTCYALVLITELYDSYIWRRIMKQDDWTLQAGRKFMLQLMGSTFFSAGAICNFVILMASQAGPTAYFTPLFFLFAAGVFAAMNNHQLLPVLVLRLLMYCISFLYIPLNDILSDNPPISDILWLQLFTCIFVMYFIIDCSFIFLKFYRRNLSQLKELSIEHEKTKVAYKAKSEFLSTVSHELRTPLTSIKGGLNLVTSGALDAVPEKRTAMLKIAETNVARLASLIEDILDLQVLEAEDHNLTISEVEMTKLLKEVVDGYRSEADKAGIALDLQMTKELFSCEIDQNRISQLIGNLISNAIKFSNSGSETRISIENLGHHLRISVADQGIGIPDGVEDKIFEKFSQLDGSDQRKVGGTGLGLNIAKIITEKHDGTLTYESELGKGSTFHIVLPLKEVHALPA